MKWIYPFLIPLFTLFIILASSSFERLMVFAGEVLSDSRQNQGLNPDAAPRGRAVSKNEAQIKEQDREKIFKHMQGFAGSLKGIPTLPKMDETIVLPEPREPQGSEKS